MGKIENAGMAGANAPAIRVSDISKSFGGVHALRHVSLHVAQGEILGLVGHNGAGKSTLIRILMGDLQPDSGVIEMQGVPLHFASVADALAKGVGVVRQELELVPDLSLAENIFLGDEQAFQHQGMLDRRAMGRAATPLLEAVGLRMAASRKLYELSIGDQQLVAAARAMRSAAKVLLLDEPTSSLSPWEAERLFAQVRRLASSGVAIVYISHRVDEVTSLCNRVVVLRDGMVVGEFSDPTADQRAILDTMAPGSDQFGSHAERIPGTPLLEVHDLQVGRHGPANFRLHAGEVLGIFGLIGAGRTTLARALVGDLQPDGGRVLFKGEEVHLRSPHHGYQAGLAYLSESRKTESIFPGLHVRNNMTLRAPQDTSRYGWLRQSKLRSLATSLIAKLDIRPGNQEMAIEQLSGGNQQKAVLARLLADSLDVFILDEPTHGIDVAAKQDLLQILNELAAQGKGVIFISSELPELMNVADRILIMRRGRVVREVNPRSVGEREIVGAAAGEQNEYVYP
ncbi:MAG: sugar ABC transporter ATP-binding protein [Chloroflexi bacterium]|nr:sugar ABC transporter ATP-binding protein [Chloroflexota bacterium]